ncbi:MAG: alcohol dehydrogenase catalytic domain-containing protein, partial [Patescibacteria group bacterium]|nr:alcohol dehydrogenase catalytic domain-containing protein [Patescibacteria group bacterium]
MPERQTTGARITMKVAYFTALRHVELHDEPAPTIDQPEQVLVRIDRLGVCGSDVHYYAEGGIGSQRVEY